MSRRSAYDERRSTHRSSSRRRSGASSSGRQRGNSVAYSTASSATTAAALPSPPQKIYAKTQVPSSSVRHGSVASSTGSGTYGPTRRWSNSPQRQTLGEQGTVENTQYVRVPEGCALSIEKGDIRRVLSAVYRVEGGVEQGVEKDVTDIIARRVEQQQGGLNIEVNKDTMRIRNDPYPGLGKVLVVTYVPTRGGVAVELARGVPSAGGGARDPQTQFLRVVEQSRLVLPRGTMTELLSAHYRVEGGGRVGLEKDVTDIVKSHVRGGGLDLPVTHATMQIRVDPCPEKEKVLVLAYRGRPEPVEQILQVKEGAWLEVPEDTIGKVLEADLRLPYHEESNHGYSVEMRQQVAGMVKGGGITGRYVTKESLGMAKKREEQKKNKKKHNNKSTQKQGSTTTPSRECARCCTSATCPCAAETLRTTAAAAPPTASTPCSATRRWCSHPASKATAGSPAPLPARRAPATSTPRVGC